MATYELCSRYYIDRDSEVSWVIRDREKATTTKNGTTHRPRAYVPKLSQCFDWWINQGLLDHPGELPEAIEEMRAKVQALPSEFRAALALPQRAQTPRRMEAGSG